MSTPALLLHGFAATARHWDRVLAALPAGTLEPIALELADADPVTPDGVLELVRRATPEERFVLAGYSMGGRVALHVALALPERIERLVLISTSAGIEDGEQRRARRAADDALAAEIEAGTIEHFVARWAAVPLFADDPEWVAAEVAQDERRCTTAALAATLRGLGAGAMTPMWHRLGELTMPVSIVVGERDTQYERAGRRLASMAADAAFTAVPGAHHRVALEGAAVVAAALAGS